MFPRSRFLPAGATNLNKSKSPDNVYYTPTYSVPITVFVRGNAQSIHGVRCVEGNKAQNTVQHWNSVFCCFLVFWNTLYTTKITTQRKQANRILLPVSVLVTKSTAQQSLSAGVCVCVCVCWGATIPMHAHKPTITISTPLVYTVIDRMFPLLMHL